MSSTRFLSDSGACELIAALRAQATRVLAPVRIGSAPYERVDMAEVHDVADVRLAAPVTARSIKECFLPASEVILRWRQKQHDVEIETNTGGFVPTVVIGARPCDAAAVEKVDKLMNWDYRDELWFGRRDATTIVAIACTVVDDSCFCTTVGGSPDGRRGVDVLLTPIAGGFHVDVASPKGEALVATHSRFFVAAEPKSGAQADDVHEMTRRRVVANAPADTARVRTWLDGHFEDGLWRQMAARCHGCGACAAVCPTCHCFDIVDEPDNHLAGARRRNWDTCQAGRFTLHGSGHNPRPDQSARYRQRVMHKFSIFPKRFAEILCTGCGRCIRACPGGMDLGEVLATIAAAAGDAGATVVATRGAV